MNHVQPLNFGANAIGKMLKEDGFLLPVPNNLSTQKRVRGGRVRFWQLRADSLLEPLESLRRGNTDRKNNSLSAGSIPETLEIV